jgi:hypothetical protein
VTRADLLRVAKERLDPEKFAVVAVSNAMTFNQPLDPRGGLTQSIDLTIPPPKHEATHSNAASTDAARKMLLRAQEASGGAEKLAAVKDLTQSVVYTYVAGGQDRETDQWIGPSYLREDGYSSRAGAIIRFTDGTTGWLSNGQMSAPLAGSGLKQTLAHLLRLQIPCLLSDRVAGRTIAAVDDETVEITQDDTVLRVVFDASTGLPSQYLYEIFNDRGVSFSMQEDLSDYRDVAGIKLPHALTMYQGGVKFADGVISGYKLNSGLKVEVLQKRR